VSDSCPPVWFGVLTVLILFSPNQNESSLWYPASSSPQNLRTGYHYFNHIPNSNITHKPASTWNNKKRW
jgi:hypothetical protein